MSFALKFPDRRKGPLWGRVGIRKGMVVVHPDVAPRALRDFEAEILILHHPTTIKRNCESRERRELTVIKRERDTHRELVLHAPVAALLPTHARQTSP